MKKRDDEKKQEKENKQSGNVKAEWCLSTHLYLKSHHIINRNAIPSRRLSTHEQKSKDIFRRLSEYMYERQRPRTLHVSNFVCPLSCWYIAVSMMHLRKERDRRTMNKIHVQCMARHPPTVEATLEVPTASTPCRCYERHKYHWFVHRFLPHPCCCLGLLTNAAHPSKNKNNNNTLFGHAAPSLRIRKN